MRVRVIVAAALCALLAPASAHAQKPYYDAGGAGSPRTLMAPGRALTGPATGTPAAQAESYVRAHRGPLGLTAADVDALGTPETATGPGGLKQVRWTQGDRGIPLLGAGVQVNLDARGRVLGAIGAARHDVRVRSIVPELDARAALRRATALDGGRGAVAVATGPTGPRRDTRFTDGAQARLVLFADGDSVRLAWRVDHDVSPAASYDTVIDASTGRLLRRVNLVKDDYDASVWDYYPGAPSGGTAQTQHLTALGYLPATAMTLSNPWIHLVSDGAEVAPGSNGYVFPFTPFTGSACNPSPPCSWSPGTVTSWQTNQKQDAVEAFYLANVYREHLFSLDFPTALRQGLIQIQADDRADAWRNGFINNASMQTAAPGATSIMSMYLWGADPDFRAVNGGDDASILYHEYTHWMTDRLVHDSDGLSALNGPQAGAMAEGFSDWYAKAFLNDKGYQPDSPAPGEVDMGVYTDAVPNSIRSEPMDCPVGTTSAACPHGGYTYGDFGRIGAGGPEVHADGEIWGQTLWDLRAALIAADPVDGGLRAQQLVTDSLPLAPQEPSFLDMRDAILQAATADGIPTDTVWSVFARRGMGVYAVTHGSDDTAPVEDFMTPPPPGTPTGSISGIVRDGDSGQPVAGITVAVGGVTSGPYAHTAVTDAAGHYTIAGVPAGDYGRLVFAPAAGSYATASVSGVSVAGGATTPVDGTVFRDWAAAAGGGAIFASNNTAGAPDCGPAQLIDGDDTTGWSAAFAAGGTAPQTTVALPAAIDVTRMEILPVGLCGDDASSAAAGYRVEVADAGGIYHTVLQGTLSPGVVNRLALDSTGRFYALGTRYVRLTITSPQSRTGTGASWVDVAEMRVFGAPAPPPGGGTPTPTATPTATPLATPTPAPPKQPSFSLRSSGRRGVAFTVTCRAACSVTGTLSVSRSVARKLRLGARRVVGKVTARLPAAARRTYTVRLDAAGRRALKRRKVRSFRATLTVQAAYPGAVVAFKHRTVTVRR